MKRSILFVGYALLVLLFFFSQTSGMCQNPGEKSYKLFFNTKKGQELKYDYLFTIKRIAEVNDRKIERNSTTKAVINYSLDDIDDSGNMIISLTYDSLSIESIGARGKTVADTKKNIGIPIYYKITKSGNVLETKGLDALPEIPAFNTKGEYDLKSFLIQLPYNEVKINDTWSDDWEYTYEGPSGWQKNEFSTIYKLVAEVEKDGFDCLKIETTTKEKMNGKQTYGEREIILSGEMELKGEIYFAYKEGILIEKTYTEDAGKLHMKTTTDPAREVIYTNFAKAHFSLIK